MYNWSTDAKKMKADPGFTERWELQQLINYGLNGRKISKKILKRHGKNIKIDPARRRLLDILLHGD